MQTGRIVDQELTDSSTVHDVLIEDDGQAMRIAAPDMKAAESLMRALIECGVEAS